MLPQNVELEKTVLGKLLNLTGFEEQLKYVDMIQRDFFSVHQTFEVFNAIESCVENNTLANPHYLIEHNLVNDDSLVDILTYKFESNQKMVYSINDLKLLACRRKIIHDAHELSQIMIKGRDVASNGEKMLLQITNTLNYGKRRKRKDSAHMMKTSLENIIHGHGLKNLVKYNVPFLDIRCNHERGQTHVIGAQPGVGKTAIGLTIARAAILAGKRVVFFVRESTKEELFERMIAMESGLPYDLFKFRSGEMTSPEFTRLKQAYSTFHQFRGNIHFFGCDDYDHSLSQMDEILDDITQDNGVIDIVIEDYIQNMPKPRWMPANTPTHEIISYNMEGVSSMHKRHKVAGITLAQLNRDMKGKPHITNLKGSSMLEQEGHIITFLHRERNTAPVEGKIPTEIYCEKHRLGAEYDGVTIGLRLPQIDFVEMTGYFNNDQPKRLVRPTI